MNNTPQQLEMDPGDRALIQSYAEKYINTGKQPTDKDKAKMLELTQKYNIKVNTNPRPILSRYARVRRNEANPDGTGIPQVNTEKKPLSKAGRKKKAATERKQVNRDRH